jgi:hypothetical protein
MRPLADPLAPEMVRVSASHFLAMVSSMCAGTVPAKSPSAGMTTRSMMSRSVATTPNAPLLAINSTLERTGIVLRRSTTCLTVASAFASSAALTVTCPLAFGSTTAGTAGAGSASGMVTGAGTGTGAATMAARFQIAGRATDEIEAAASNRE